MRKSFSTFKLTLALVLLLFPLFPLASQNPSPTNLISPTTGIDYTSLEKLLSAQEWRKANDKTRDLILKATGRELQGWFSLEDLQKLACWDLRTIDQLWEKYSQGRFGFSTQFPIFIETGNKPGRLVSIESYQDFGDRVGWRKDGDWIIFKENFNYTLNAPKGHLPSPRTEYQISGGRLEYSTFAQRLVACQIVNSSKK